MLLYYYISILIWCHTHFSVKGFVTQVQVLAYVTLIHVLTLVDGELK